MDAPDKEPAAQVLKPEGARDSDIVPNNTKDQLTRDPNQVETDDSKVRRIARSAPSINRSYSVIRTDENEYEPFPDYYESCSRYDKGDATVELIDKEHEEAYNLAIAKVIEEVIRFREIDASIADLSSSVYGAISASNDEQHALSTTENEDPRDAQHIQTDREVANKSPEWEEVSGIVEDIKELLAHPDLKDNIRKRFIAMTNMVLRMNILLFPSPTIPTNPKEFLTGKKALEAKELAVEIVKYLASIDQQLQDCVEDAKRVAYILSIVTEDDSVSIYVIHRRIVEVVSRNLSRPRPLERHLISLFLDLYDTYVYTAFLNLRTRLIFEDELTDEKQELSRILIALWDILNRVIENYEEYVNKMKKIKEQYFDPAMDKLKNSPELWQECWENQQITLRPKEEVLQAPLPTLGVANGNDEPVVFPGDLL